MSEFFILNNLAIGSLNRRIKLIRDCLRGDSAARADAGHKRGRENAELRLNALEKERRIRQDLESQVGQRDQQRVATKVNDLAKHVSGYPLYMGSFQKVTDPCFRCGMSLRQVRSTSYRSRKDVEGKKRRRKERFDLIAQARVKAAKMPDGDAKRAVLRVAEDFTRNIDAAEKAVLSRDVYHHTDDNIKAEGAPTGYLRGSEHPELLARYQITKEMLEPLKNDLRAELYFPDPEIFGTEAHPVLSFKGTTLTSFRDWEADFYQALGKRSSYYDSAIKLGNLLRSAVGNFEVTGHSLGGALASVVAILTGCRTTVYNPAGVHPSTIGRIGPVAAPPDITAYIVKGEILNTGQDGANSVGQNLQRISLRMPLPLYSPMRLATLAVGAKLSAIPTHAGYKISLPAKVNGKTPDILTRHSIETIILSIEEEKNHNAETIRLSIAGIAKAVP